MSSNKSIISSNTSAKRNTEQAFGSSKPATACERMNIKMVQNVLLIWLDNNIDEENNADCRNTVTQLRRVVNSVNTFTDVDQCIDFLTDFYNQNIFMIISGALCQNIIPLIHDIAQLNSVFIFSANKTKYEKLTKKWFKIKDVFSEISPICDSLEKAVQQCEQNVISMSLIPTNDNAIGKNLDRLNPTFMYTQIFKEILLTMEFEQKHIQEYIDFCQEQFADNTAQLAKVKELERKYHDKTPIWWYTYEPFLYPMLNRGLRTMDGDIIIKMGFFINDLHHHIEKLHNEQFSNHHNDTPFIVYRGQGLSRVDFDELKKTKGGLLSFNNFLSTSRDRKVSVCFAESNQTNPDMIGILFVIIINPSLSSTPFASIADVSYFQGEDEVLFSMHTVFRIHDIILLGENDRLFQVDLTLTGDNDQDLRVLTDRIRQETDLNSPGWFRLSLVLLKIGQFEKAQQVYQGMLDQTANTEMEGSIYHQLGRVKNDLGQYKEAIKFHEKSLEIRQQSLPSNHPHLAVSYHSIGNVYYNMGEYSKALSCHEKALQIQQQSLPSNHPHLAASYNNIGNAYYKMGEYSKALSFHEKALEIQQQSSPSNHPDLASSYNNISTAYENMGEYSKALSLHEKALEIRQQSLPLNHPDFAMSYNDIGNVYQNMGEYSKAFSYFEKALEIRQQSLPLNHPHLASSYNSMGLVYRNMGEYSKALLYYEKVIEIQQQSLPSNHPDLASSYNIIGVVYQNMGEYSKALSYYEKALEIQQQSLPSNHPDLASRYNNIGMVYQNMGEYSKALSYMKKVLEIQQQSLPSNHPDLVISYNNIGAVYENMGEHSKALSYMKNVLEVRQQSLPSNHPDLVISYNNIGAVYQNMGEYSKARSYYERALDIGHRSLSSSHPVLQGCKNNLELVGKKL